MKLALITLYDRESFGLRHISKKLTDKGYEVKLVFFKPSNPAQTTSLNPKEIELQNCVRTIKEFSPSVVGIGIHCSFFHATAINIAKYIKSEMDIPIIVGGNHPTLSPEYCINDFDYVCVGDGTEPLIQLMYRISRGDNNFSDIPNILYKGNYSNKFKPQVFLNNLDDDYIFKDNGIIIEGENIYSGDPLLKSYSYPMLTSTGCIYKCSFCASYKLTNLRNGKKRILRKTPQEVVMQINNAINVNNRIKFIEFWDAIFPWDDEWIDEFIIEYQKVKLPFFIWTHPLQVNYKNFKKLKKVGLIWVAMGLEIGDEKLRREIFNRYETNQRIIEATQILSKLKIPLVFLDIIVDYKWQNETNMIKLNDLLLSLKGKYFIQLHTLLHFPGTKIRDFALINGFLTKAEDKRIMYSDLDKLFSELYWSKGFPEDGPEWFRKQSMIAFLLQFKFLRKKYLLKKFNSLTIDKLYDLSSRIDKIFGAQSFGSPWTLMEKYPKITDYILSRKYLFYCLLRIHYITIPIIKILNRSK